jgi:hypothetical protein
MGFGSICLGILDMNESGARAEDFNLLDPTTF